MGGNSFALLYRERDAVLVDTFLAIEQSHILADLILAIGRNSKLICDYNNAVQE